MIPPTHPLGTHTFSLLLSIRPQFPKILQKNTKLIIFFEYVFRNTPFSLTMCNQKPNLINCLNYNKSSKKNHHPKVLYTGNFQKIRLTLCKVPSPNASLQHSCQKSPSIQQALALRIVHQKPDSHASPLPLLENKNLCYYYPVNRILWQISDNTLSKGTKS